MLILVTGASGSGKSKFAENAALQFGQHVTYIAAMKPDGADAQKRIDRHRAMRQGKGFHTVERYTDIKSLDVRTPAILECLPNLLANEMFSPEGCGAENAENETAEGIRTLAEKCGNLVVVTDEVGSDGVTYDAATEKYKKILGSLNRRIARAADEVYEVVCGVPMKIKQEGRSCTY